METSPDEIDGDVLGEVVEGSVAPRPVGWISTVSEEGVPNLAPYAQIMPVSVEPPVLGFAALPGKEGTKDTPENALDTEEFVINVPTEDLVQKVCDTAPPIEGDEFEAVNVHKEEATSVQPPRVSESPIHLECVTGQVEEIGPGPTTVVFGDIEHVHVDDSLVTEDGLDLKNLESVGYLTGSFFTRLDVIS